VHRIVERLRGDYTNLASRPVLRRRCRQPPDLAAGLHLRTDLGVHHPLLLGGHPHQSTRHQRRNVILHERRRKSS
jgi:hypothetical protein